MVNKRFKTYRIRVLNKNVAIADKIIPTFESNDFALYDEEDTSLGRVYEIVTTKTKFLKLTKKLRENKINFAITRK